MLRSNTTRSFPLTTQFLEIADYLVFNYKPGSLVQLESILKGLVPAEMSSYWFDPSILPGIIDLYDLMNEQTEIPPAKSFDISVEGSHAVKHFMGFIEKNRDAITTG